MYILKNETVSGMEIASCLFYSKGEFNKSGIHLIVGHNYCNGRLFSNNNKLQVGDVIYITSQDGTRTSYTIYNKFVTDPEDVSFLRGSASSAPEIVLQTCTNDETGRIIIQAR